MRHRGVYKSLQQIGINRVQLFGHFIGLDRNIITRTALELYIEG